MTWIIRVWFARKETKLHFQAKIWIKRHFWNANVSILQPTEKRQIFNWTTLSAETRNLPLKTMICSIRWQSSSLWFYYLFQRDLKHLQQEILKGLNKQSIEVLDLPQCSTFVWWVHVHIVSVSIIAVYCLGCSSGRIVSRVSWHDECYDTALSCHPASTSCHTSKYHSEQSLPHSYHSPR